MKETNIKLLHNIIKLRYGNEEESEKYGQIQWRNDGVYIFIIKGIRKQTEINTIFHELLHYGSDELGINLTHEQIYVLAFFFTEVYYKIIKKGVLEK